MSSGSAAGFPALAGFRAANDAGLVAIVRAFGPEGHCSVEAEIRTGHHDPVHRTYRLGSTDAARAFVAEAADAFVHLGCDVE